MLLGMGRLRGTAGCYSGRLCMYVFAYTTSFVILHRLAGVDVYLSASSALTGGTLCATGVAAASKGDSLTVSCPATANALYLRIERPSATPTFLGLREVMVYATSGAVPLPCRGFASGELAQPPAAHMTHAWSSWPACACLQRATCPRLQT